MSGLSATVALLSMLLAASAVAAPGGLGPSLSVPISVPTVAPISPDAKMLVESDEMVYDYDHDVVAAVGNVKIYYGGYTLEAQKVTYNRGTGRLIATGQVTLTDPTGASYYSEYIDITDDFRDGFVQSLRVDTAQHTYFAASKAERSAGETTTFVGGVYTACAPCKEHPERPPLWDVKAA